MSFISDLKSKVLNGYNPQNIVHKNNKDTIRVLTGVDKFFEVPFVDEEKRNVDKFYNLNLVIKIINK